MITKMCCPVWKEVNWQHKWCGVVEQIQYTENYTNYIKHIFSVFSITHIFYAPHAIYINIGIDTYPPITAHERHKKALFHTLEIHKIKSLYIAP